MSYRKRIHKQRRLERDHAERLSARRQLTRNLLLGTVALGALVAIAVCGLIFLPGGSAESPVASVSVSIGDNFFQPNSVSLKAGQKTKIVLYNGGAAMHNLWSSGPDAESGNGDDIRSEDLAGGEFGSVEAKFDEPGEYGFSCTFHAGQSGIFVVEP